MGTSCSMRETTCMPREEADRLLGLDAELRAAAEAMLAAPGLGTIIGEARKS